MSTVRWWSRARWAALVSVAAAGLAVGGDAAAAGTRAANTDPATALTVQGEPLRHTFDLAHPGDAVAGEWRVSAAGTASRAAPVPFDGVLTADRPVAETLARALAVEYGRVDAVGRLVEWHAAGTLAEPVSYGDALGAEPRVHAGGQVVVPVRVSLPDPAAVTGAPGEVQVVRAAFVVSWFGDAPAGSGAVPPPGAGTAPDPVRRGLARTGGTAAALALGAAALLRAGTALARRPARSATTGPTAVTKDPAPATRGRLRS
ncbi:hypothetical protein [Cellulosimicrobium cellulans]|uniref:hypothetical protein n=1 Tax=Cellulosimicrobium cellulans TaxID=1710 RepID=UPI00130E4952|nr:hypothetical protein [Cellulosimicrobium cellulans]